jgi:SAM-dependent methyltransferase
MDKQTVSSYDHHAETVASRYEAVESPHKGLCPHWIGRDDTVLDIGCGSGRDLAFFHQQGCTVFGIDPSISMLRQAAACHPELEGKLAEGSLPGNFSALGNRRFDVILLSAVIMHMTDSDLAASVSALEQHLTDHGRLIISHSPARGDLAPSGRDPLGRLFLVRSSEAVKLLLQKAGFICIHAETGSDSLQRADIRWETLVFRDASGAAGAETVAGETAGA